jgi:Fe-S oxidoreductase
MKNHLAYYYCLCTILCLASCASDNTEGDTKEAITDSIVEEYNQSATRGPADMVEALYQELMAQNENLLTLDKNMDVLRREQAKAVAPYMLYNGKSTQYYTNALNLSNGISDSLLKNSVEVLIKKSQHQFTTQSATMNKSMNSLNIAYQQLEDRYSALKIILTLNLIEKYQAQKTPPTPAYTQLIEKMEQHMKLIDSLKQAH